MKNAVNSLYIKMKKVIPFNIIKKSLSTHYHISFLIFYIFIMVLIYSSLFLLYISIRDSIVKDSLLIKITEFHFLNILQMSVMCAVLYSIFVSLSKLIIHHVFKINNKERMVYLSEKLIFSIMISLLFFTTLTPDQFSLFATIVSFIAICLTIHKK